MNSWSRRRLPSQENVLASTALSSAEGCHAGAVARDGPGAVEAAEVLLSRQPHFANRRTPISAHGLGPRNLLASTPSGTFRDPLDRSGDNSLSTYLWRAWMRSKCSCSAKSFTARACPCGSGETAMVWLWTNCRCAFRLSYEGQRKGLFRHIWLLQSLEKEISL